jgi:predicted DNA-binding protein
MTKYDQTTINLPEETKRKVRMLAAEMGISMGKAALKLIELGLEDYQYLYAISQSDKRINERVL